MGESMINKWEYFYKNLRNQFCYGSKDSSYRKAAIFLDGLPLIEDWGCGTCYAKQFFKSSKYVGIDGTKSNWSDIVDDLQFYKSNINGILMRHVLEHNRNWKTILKNALNSFQNKMCLIMFLEFSTITYEYYISPEGIPNIQFKLSDITDNFINLKYYIELLSDTGETIFYLEK